jgi:ATP-binding protein involved in chromosome partitioning
MLRPENVSVKILGLVENMAWFTPAELPNNRYYIFGKNGVSKLAKEQNLPLLAQIPLVQGICDSGDNGKPISQTNDATKGAFEILADNMLKQL